MKFEYVTIIKERYQRDGYVLVWTRPDRRQIDCAKIAKRLHLPLDKIEELVQWELDPRNGLAEFTITWLNHLSPTKYLQLSAVIDEAFDRRK